MPMTWQTSRSRNSINFLNTSFFLNLSVDKDNLTSLDLSSGFIDLKEVKNHTLWKISLKVPGRSRMQSRKGKLR